MSILVGLDHKEDPEEERDDELLVFGYACQLYNDAETALKEDTGSLLIPWMGERSLMIDRYDGRAHLSDKATFCLKPNIVRRLAKEDEDMEATLDEERYLSLNRDIMEEELMKEEEEKRSYEALQPDGYYTAVGYEYENSASKEDSAPKPPPAPPMSSVLVNQSSEEDAFVPPEGLAFPAGMATPSTNKLHAIIEKTAVFIAQRGPQMEIMIKAKQKHNPYFAFLDFEDHLNPYYKHLLQALRTRAYVPQPQVEAETAVVTSTSIAANENASPTKGDEAAPARPTVSAVLSSGDESDGEYDLHPLLRIGLQSKTPLTAAGATTSRGQSVTSEQRPQQPSSLLDEAPWNQPAPEQQTMSSAAGDAYDDYYKYWSHSWSQYYGGGGGGGPPLQHSQLPSAAATSSDYSAYAAMAQYHQYYAALYAQYLQPASTASSTAPQQAKHPYEEALARLPQSVLDQPPNPPPPNIQPIVDKMAEYAANNGEEFEKTVLEKNKNDPRFSFLRPGNEYHAYYATKKLLCLTKLREASEKQKQADKAAVHSLKPDGSVGFALGGSKLQASNVVLEDSSSEEDESEGLLDGVEVVSEKAERKKKKAASKGAENGNAAATVDNTETLEEREKQVERRRKAALFIEELRRKRELQLEQERGTEVNEDSDEFVGPKRRHIDPRAS